MTGNWGLSLFAGGHVLRILYWRRLCCNLLPLLSHRGILFVVALLLRLGGYRFQDLLVGMRHYHSLASEVSSGVACRAASEDIPFISLFSCRVLIDLVVSDINAYLIPNAREIFLRE